MENTKMSSLDLVYARNLSDLVGVNRVTSAIGGIRQPVTGTKKGWWPKANTLCFEGEYRLDCKVGLWRYYSRYSTEITHTDIHFNL